MSVPVEGAAHQKSDKERPERASREAASSTGRGEAPPVRQSDGNLGRTLLEQALTRENMERAWKRVRANKGSAGVDGRSVKETGVYLKTHWPRLKAQLLCGTYRPSPIRRVEIAKSEGGVRELGIPTVTDRLIQQALLQVLQPLIDPGFSEHSYGFRPGRRAHDALLCAQAHVQAGYRVVVDIDLERFFDRVNHDVLLDRLNRRIGDRAVLRLVRRYLEAGVMVHGVVQERYEGTPQGGPLSPLLANVLLDEVDRELERRGHRLRSAMPTTATCMYAVGKQASE
jgi:group II intron reverse transcriptase/maturase